MDYNIIAGIILITAQLVVITAMVFVFMAWPLYLFFIAYRRRQINKPDYDALTTSPIHVALTTMFSAAYGIVLPSLMFLAVRSHQKFGLWEFIEPINTPWKVALASVAMIWLAERLIVAGLNFDRPRFAGWLDRAGAGLGLFMCLHYHLFFYLFNPFNTTSRPEFFIKCCLPHLFVLGATLVYLFALIEACRRKEPVARRKQRAAWAIATAAILIVLSPLWLSVPRVTHRQAMNIVKSHIDSINDSAAAAEIDPRLLAGFIYVAQTRDKSMLSGPHADQLLLAVLQHDDASSLLRDTLPDPRTGVFPLHCNEQLQILECIELSNGFEKYAMDAKLDPCIAFYGLGNRDNHDMGPPEKLPEALVDLIQSNPRMDPVFNSFVVEFEDDRKAYLRSQVDIQWASRRVDMALPTLPYLYGCSPHLREIVNNRDEDEDEMMEDEYYDAASSMTALCTDFVPRFPEFPMLEAQPTRKHGFLKHFYGKESIAIIADGEMSVPLGAAMIKRFDIQARKNAPDKDRIFEIVRRTPYLHPRDFTGRLKTIMHSPEFDRLFGPTPKMEASQ